MFHSAVSKEDKSEIRTRLIPSGLNEHDARLALQNALVIAKIVRFEYPADWPDVISTLVDTVRNAQGPLQLSRALLILLYTTKELSRARLARTKQNLQSVTPELVRVLGSLYVSKSESWQNAIAQSSPDADEILQCLDHSLLCFKVLRRLILVYEFPNRESDVQELWNITFRQIGSFMGVASQISLGLPPNMQQQVEKHLVQMAKLHHEMSVDHPAAFVLLPRSLELVQAYWSLVRSFGETFGSKEAVTSAVAAARIGTDDDADEKSYTEKLALKGLLIIRACLKMLFNPRQTFNYRQPVDKEEQSQASQALRDTFFSQAFVQEIMETTITRYFVFRASDLREWEEDPEEWERREEGESEGFEFSIRACSEKLFLDLAINYKDILVQPLLSVFYSVATPDNEEILLKDSLYTAIGLSAAVVHEQLDFDAFIRNVLVLEVQKQKPGFKILRRRIAILLGQWITVNVSERTLVYQIFQHLLDSKDKLNDEVVRVTAGRQLKNVADAWEFQALEFLPYAEAVLTRLMRLIEEVELTETKMVLLNTISVIVERMENHITPFAERIISLLPPLWEQSGEEHLMKQAILTILSRLVNAMKAASLQFHPMVFPIIEGAVEPGSETQLYLLEDALDLWSAILVQTPAPASPDLLSLSQYLIPIFELGSESLRKALEITESYVLLAPLHMLSDGMRKHVLSSMSNMLGTLRPEANGQVNNLVEVMIRAAEKLGGEAAVSQMASDMVDTQFLVKLLGGLKGSWVAHCTTGPLAKDPPVDGVVETDYFAVLARTVLGSVSASCQACHAAANVNENNASLDDVMKWLLEEWFGHMDNVGDPARSKLMCLALTKLLETHQSFMLMNLQSLMSLWTSDITALREDEADISGDSFVLNKAEGLASNELPSDLRSPEDDRRRELTYSDPVHTINLPAYVKHYLQQTISTCGGYDAFRQEWLVNVDQDVISAFGELQIM